MTPRTRNADRAPRQHVRVQTDSESLYWASRLGCTVAELRAAVFAVGTPIEAVLEHLQWRRCRAPATPMGRRAGRF